MRGAAVELDDIGDSIDSADSDRDTPKSVREKNRQAQRRFRERQKVGCAESSRARHAEPPLCSMPCTSRLWYQCLKTTIEVHQVACYMQNAISGLADEVEDLRERLKTAQTLNHELVVRVRSLRTENNSLRSPTGLRCQNDMF